MAHRNSSAPARDSPTDFDLIADLLSSTGADHDQDEDEVRNILKAVLKLFWIQAIGHMKNIEKEMEILRNAPPSDRASRPPNQSSSTGDEAWKLDTPMGGGLLDKNGRVSSTFHINIEYKLMMR
jgi:immunoglobulin-binding protein 1